MHKKKKMKNAIKCYYQATHHESHRIYCTLTKNMAHSRNVTYQFPTNKWLSKQTICGPTTTLHGLFASRHMPVKFPLKKRDSYRKNKQQPPALTLTHQIYHELNFNPLKIICWKKHKTWDMTFHCLKFRTQVVFDSTIKNPPCWWPRLRLGFPTSNGSQLQWDSPQKGTVTVGQWVDIHQTCKLSYLK